MSGFLPSCNIFHICFSFDIRSVQMFWNLLQSGNDWPQQTKCNHKYTYTHTDIGNCLSDKFPPIRVCAAVFLLLWVSRKPIVTKKPTQTSINVFPQGTNGMLRNHFVYHNPIHSFVVHSNGHLVESIRSVGHWRWGFGVRQGWVRSLLWVYGNLSSTLVHCIVYVHTENN